MRARHPDAGGRRRPALRRAIGAVALVSALSACTAQFRNHGYTPSEAELAEIVVGRDTRETVASAVGTPTSGGVLQDTGYYYVSQRVRSYGIREDEVVDRQIVAITFDGQGVVRNIERYSLQDGNVVALSRRVTDSNVEGVGFLRQLAGNLGRIAPTTTTPQ
ncbi:MAG: outer membrane protein assembly factor BamE [Pseudomonadota bacterium]